jgi:hypothetical protein
VLRPVGLSEKDRQTSTEWVCNTIFEKHNATSRRLAERIVWKNEKEARDLNEGNLAVPIIVVKSGDGKSQTYKGWNPQVKTAIESSFGQLQDALALTGVTASRAVSVLSGTSGIATESVCEVLEMSLCSE